MPAIAIIGRQNVGKSTLFNAIIRQRKSIVLDQPGVTRDLVSHEISIANQKLRITDFPGFEFDKDLDHDDELTRQAISNAEQKLKDFNLLLWVVSRKGLSAFEQNLAKELHRTGRPVWLVINFVDDPVLEAEAYDLFSLGFKKNLMVSALNKRGISDLVKQLFDHFYSDREKSEPTTTPDKADQHEAIKVAIIGKPNAGKSTLFNWLMKKDLSLTSDIPGTTRDSIEDVFTFQKHSLRIIDTAGMRKKRNVDTRVEAFSVMRTQDAIRSADVVLFLIDAREGLDFQNKHILNMIAEENKAMILLANKSDLLTPEEKQQLQDDLRFSHKKFWNFPFFFTCALDGKKVTNVLELLLKLNETRRREFSTAFLNKVVSGFKEATVMVDHQVKLSYMIQAKPGLHFILFTNRPSVSANVRRFVLNQLRKQLNLEQVPVRLTMKYKNQ